MTRPKPSTAEAVAATKPLQNAAQAKALADYSWAVNGVKLQRAQKWVRENELTRALAGAAQDKAIKDRYVAIGGLLRGAQPAGGKPTGAEVNISDDDGSLD